MSDKEFNSKILPATVREYITALVKKMRYRRKVREDVRAEITSHFEDELKDCKTSEEKEQKARLLVTEFGDFKLLAILLRRAKKRCRPLWRTVAARTFQTIGVLIVCFIFYTIWFSFGRPTIDVDYLKLFNLMNQPKIQKQDNAWPLYEKAFELYVPQSRLVKQVISYRHNGRDREDAIRLKHMLQDNAQQIQEWLEKNQKYWDGLTPEQQKVLLECLESDWIPFPKIINQSYKNWRTTPISLMAEHIIQCIKEGTQLTPPPSLGTLNSSMYPEFPTAELNNWLENNTIPPNYLEAVSVMVLHEAIKQFKDLPEEISAPLTDIECEYIGRWLEQNEAAWRQFKAGSEKSYCYRPYAYDPNDRDKSLWSIPLPPLNPLRDLTRMGIWRSRIDRDQGRLQQSIDDCLAVARSANHWQGKGTLVQQLVGLAINNMAHEEILNILADRKLSADELEGLQEQLSKIYPGNYPSINIESERLIFMDVVQHSFTDGGPGGGHLIPGSWEKYTDLNFPAPAPDADETEERLFMPFYTAVSMLHARRDATVAKANEIFDLQNKLTRMTPYERHVSNIKTPDEIMYDSWKGYRFLLIQIFLPATTRVSELAYRGKMVHEATLAITAILRWRLQNNQYPAALDELTAAGLLKDLPKDPYSDKSLVYKKKDDDFTLYSIGPNFKDDGGEVFMKDGNPRRWGTDEAGDIVFWPVAKSMPH
jgi:hypothetical protein